jgi:hypothetical protein
MNTDTWFWHLSFMSQMQADMCQTDADAGNSVPGKVNIDN